MASCSILRRCFATQPSSSTTASYPFIKFKFPANSPPPTVQYGAKASPSLIPTFALPPISENYGNFISCGRRGLIFLSTMPLLFPLQEYVNNFNVEAQELKAPDYLLIKDEIRKVLSKGKAAGVLRLVFHDAGTFELSENSVSWADMIALAGAEAVSICGGPEITVRLGRLDSLTPDPEGKLPEESLDACSLKQCFQRKGFSTQELVALSGAHTLGSKGFGSPVEFDNSYYKILLEKPWLSSAGMSAMVGLPSDRALVDDDECLSWITRYANDQNLFFEDFKNVYIKLVNSGARWKAQ